jgi:hypothetical protein
MPPSAVADEFRVQAVVPAGYASYGRLIHPAYEAVEGAWQRVPMSSIAQPEEHLWKAPSSGWAIMTGLPVGDNTAVCPYLGARRGSPDPDDLTNLIEILAAYTSTPDQIWGLAWPGWGVHPECDWLEAETPKVHVGNDDHGLMQGPLSGVPTVAGLLTYAPSYWWPQDRAWVVGSQMQDLSTYIAADDECIEALIAGERIDVVRAAPDDPVWAKPYYPVR